jgi:hypothetical protein
VCSARIASYPEFMGNVLCIVQRVISTHVIKAVPRGVGPVVLCHFQPFADTLFSLPQSGLWDYLQ